MKARTGLCLLLLGMLLMAAYAKKGKKSRKSPPQWKASSMPAMNKRFESVYEGVDLTLDCKAQAHPKPKVKWHKDGVELKSGNNVEVKKFNLVFKSLTTDMSGNYTCVVSNKHGQKDWTFHLDVQVKVWPLLVEGPNNITQMVGSNVAFRCRVLNDPQATIRWQKQKASSNKNIDEIPPQNDFLKPDDDDSQVLTLDNIQKHDEGEYKCMAGNVWGLKYTSAWLTVIEPVLVPDLPRPEVGKKKDKNNINSNNVVQSELPGKDDAFDPNESEEGGMDNSLYDGGYIPEGAGPFDYGPDLYFTTTKQPKNRNNRKKNGRKKDRKGKDKTLIDEDESIITVTPSLKAQPTVTMDSFRRTTYAEIWHFENKHDDNEEVSDTRYNPVLRYNPVAITTTDKDESGITQNTSMSDQDEYIEGSISLWTIYTIVGAIGGVILLIGLVAITLTLCCKKEEGSVYKSTPV